MASFMMSPCDRSPSPSVPRRQLSVEIPALDFAYDVSVDALAREPEGGVPSDGDVNCIRPSEEWDSDEEDDEMWDIDIRRSVSQPPRRYQQADPACSAADPLSRTYLPDPDLFLLGLHLPAALPAGGVVAGSRPCKEPRDVFRCASPNRLEVTASDASAQLKLLEVKLQVLEAQHRVAAALRCDRRELGQIGGGKVVPELGSATSPSSGSASRSSSVSRSASRRRVSSGRSISALSGASSMMSLHGKSGAPPSAQSASPPLVAKPEFASARFGGSSDDVAEAQCSSVTNGGSRGRGGSHDEREGNGCGVNKQQVDKTAEGAEDAERREDAVESPQLKTCVSPRLVACMTFRPACVAPRTNSPVRCRPPHGMQAHGSGVNRLIAAFRSHRTERSTKTAAAIPVATGV